MPESQTMTPLPFRLDEQTLVRSAWLNASRYDMRIFWFAVFISVAGTGVILFRNSQWTVQEILISTAGPLVVIAALTFGLRLIMFPIHARRNFRQQKALSEDMALSWTEKEFKYASGKSHTEMLFADLYGYRASPELILLYRSNLLFHAVPVSAFGGPALHDAFIRKLDEAGVRHR